MADYSYIQNVAALKRFLIHLKSAGVPKKVTIKYLVGSGFKSSSDRRIISVLKSIDFLDNSGIPTDKWKAFRDTSQSSSIMADALLSSYQDLFSNYPDAYNKDEEALRNFFSAETELGSRAISLMVGTFKGLCEFADFKNLNSKLPEQGRTPATPSTTPMPNTHAQTTNKEIIININIQLTIPESDNADVYDNFFAAMKKHLIPDE